jgi:hypothetical protein
MIRGLIIDIRRTIEHNNDLVAKCQELATANHNMAGLLTAYMRMLDLL